MPVQACCLAFWRDDISDIRYHVALSVDYDYDKRL